MSHLATRYDKLSRRRQKVESVLRNAIMSLMLEGVICKNLVDCRMIGVSRVSVSLDLSYATVFVTIPVSDQEKEVVISMLNKDSWRVRMIVAKAVVLRKIPKIEFRIDAKAERVDAVLRILDGLQDKDN